PEHHSARIVVEFHDSSGVSHRVREAFITGPVKPIGAPVQIRYVPSNPGRAKIDDVGNLWAGPILLLIVGNLSAIASALCSLLVCQNLGYWLKKTRDSRSFQSAD